MKIVFLFPRFGIGGIGTALSFVARVYAEAGIEVVCIAMSNEPIMIILPDSSKKYYITDLSGSRGFKGLYEKAAFLKKYRKILRKEKPDFILSFGTDLVRISVLASYGLGVRIIGSERGNPYNYTEKLKKKYVWALSKCKMVVFQTEQAKAYYPKEVQKKSVIIPNAAFIKKADTTKDSSKDKTIIITYSRLSPEKNIDGIVRAFKICFDRYQSHPKDIHKKNIELHIYGNGPEKKRIEEEIERTGLSNILLHEGVSDIQNKLAVATVYILNSVTEGFPNALVEAMVSGVACIATDCPTGAVKSITENGKRACLIPIKDDSALADAIYEVLANDTYREEIIHRSMELKEELSPVVIGKKWIELIRSIDI